MPAVPLNVELGLDGVVTVPSKPLTMLQTPAPTVGVLAARVTCVRPQVAAPVWFVPAFASVGFWLNVTFTSLVEAGQGELLTVQRSIYAVPATPLNVELGLEGVVTAPPAPLTMLHAPVPMVGVLAARVTCVRPQVEAPV